MNNLLAVANMSKNHTSGLTGLHTPFLRATVTNCQSKVASKSLVFIGFQVNIYYDFEKFVLV